MYLHSNTEVHGIVVARRRVVSFNLNRYCQPPPAAPANIKLSRSCIVCVVIVVVDSVNDSQCHRKQTLSISTKDENEASSWSWWWSDGWWSCRAWERETSRPMRRLLISQSILIPTYVDSNLLKLSNSHRPIFACGDKTELSLKSMRVETFKTLKLPNSHRFLPAWKIMDEGDFSDISVCTWVLTSSRERANP